MHRTLKVALGLGVLVALVLGGWALGRTGASTATTRSPRPVVAQMPAFDEARSDPRDERPAPSQLSPGTAGDAPSTERAQTRAKILKALAQARDEGASHPAADATDAKGEPEIAPTTGTFTDRIGDRPYLTRVLSDEIMPLVDECLTQAREREAALGGMLAIEFEIVADPEHGGIVEHAAASERNEVADAELIECVRESTLSAILPAPEDGGRESLLITIPTGDED